jgi:predicted dinucleotide-binding enzyme
MKTAVLGTGMVGRTIAARMAELGHTVTIGTRDPDATLARTAADASLNVLAQAGAENLDGKVILDIANPLDFSNGMPPTLFVKDSDSLGEQIQRAFPAARVVKTLNTLNADLMAHPEQLADPGTVEGIRPPRCHRPR